MSNFSDMEKFNNLSIRARAAYGILCLESFINHLGYNADKWLIITDELWKFTNSNPGIWHEYMSEMTPFAINENIPFESKGCDHINKGKHDLLQQLYQYADNDLLTTIDLIFNIGTRDLYSSVTKGSPDTINYLKEIIRIINCHTISLPDIALVRRFTITENEGWGKEFSRNDLSE